MDEAHFSALKKAKSDNYEQIYRSKEVEALLESTVRPMMQELYHKLLQDLINENLSSPIFTHHFSVVDKPYYKRELPYRETEPNQIVVDYIASMTDDYFVDLHSHFFPKSNLQIKYKGYFD